MPEYFYLENPIYHIIRALSLHGSVSFSRVLFPQGVLSRSLSASLWIILWIMLMSLRHVDTLTFR